MTDQVIWVHVAVHAHIGPTRGQVANHTARTWPEILEWVLSIDSALNCMALQRP